MTKEKAAKIIKFLKLRYGNIDKALSYNNLFQLTIAVVLSAQTTDKQVNSVTPALFKQYKDFKFLARASIPEIEKIIKSVGLYKTKAGNIVCLSRDIIKNYNGKLPRTREIGRASCRERV